MGSGGDALISLSLVPLRGPRIAALDVFLVDVFILNRSRFVRHFAIGLPPTTTTTMMVTSATTKATPRSSSSLSLAAKGGKDATGTMAAGLLALENDFRIGCV
jgi:hypothetical protein